MLPYMHKKGNIVQRRQQSLHNAYIFYLLIFLQDPNHKSIWLDYVLVVPAQQFTQEIMHELPVERTTEYIKYCGHNNFHIDSNSSGVQRLFIFLFWMQVIFLHSRKGQKFSETIGFI